MDKIQRQILKNQSTILLALSSMDSDVLNSINERVKETFLFFNEDSKEPCCEMDVKCEDGEK